MLVTIRPALPLAAALLCALFLAPAMAAAGELSCRLCPPSNSPLPQRDVPAQPLRINVVTQLNFAQIVLPPSGSASLAIDPETGAPQSAQGLTNLGGSALRGEVEVTGEPGRAIRVTMPLSIDMVAANGARARVRDLSTNLPAQPRLDQYGQLRFAFGGRLEISGHASGQFRGRIAITADYE
jgi:hypothetical protein